MFLCDHYDRYLLLNRQYTESCIAAWILICLGHSGQSFQYASLDVVWRRVVAPSRGYPSTVCIASRTTLSNSTSSQKSAIERHVSQLTFRRPKSPKRDQNPRRSITLSTLQSTSSISSSNMSLSEQSPCYSPSSSSTAASKDEAENYHIRLELRTSDQREMDLLVLSTILMVANKCDWLRLPSSVDEEMNSQSICRGNGTHDDDWIVPPEDLPPDYMA